MPTAPGVDLPYGVDIYYLYYGFSYLLHWTSKTTALKTDHLARDCISLNPTGSPILEEIKIKLQVPSFNLKLVWGCGRDIGV